MAAKGILVPLFLLVMVNVHMGSACKDIQPTEACIKWMNQGNCNAASNIRRICAKTCNVCKTPVPIQPAAVPLPPAPVPIQPAAVPLPPAPTPSSCGVKGPDNGERRRRYIDLLTSRFQEFKDRDSSSLERRRRQSNRKPRRLQGPDILRSRRQSSIIQPFIHGGHETGKREYPWQVAIKYNGHFHCSGSIIGDQYILTAAHCVIRYRYIPNRYKLILGDWDLTTSDEQAHVTTTASNITIHPNYTAKPWKNDIAVLKLRDKIDFSPDNIGPICLPGSDFNPEGRLATVTGWGKNENGRLQPRLNELTAKIMSNVQCDKAWSLIPGGTSGLIQKSMLCMESHQGDICTGDSGGPSVVEVGTGSGSYYVQVGVVSHGGTDGCGNSSAPGVYARVTSYLDWINQQMKH